MAAMKRRLRKEEASWPFNNQIQYIANIISIVTAVTSLILAVVLFGSKQDIKDMDTLIGQIIKQNEKQDSMLAVEHKLLWRQDTITNQLKSIALENQRLNQALKDANKVAYSNLSSSLRQIQLIAAQQEQQLHYSDFTLHFGQRPLSKADSALYIYSKRPFRKKSDLSLSFSIENISNRNIENMIVTGKLENSWMKEIDHFQETISLQGKQSTVVLKLLSDTIRTDTLYDFLSPVRMYYLTMESINYDSIINKPHKDMHYYTLFYKEDRKNNVYKTRTTEMTKEEFYRMTNTIMKYRYRPRE